MAVNFLQFLATALKDGRKASVHTSAWISKGN